MYGSVCLNEIGIDTSTTTVEERIELNDFLSPFFQKICPETEHFTLGAHKVKVPGGAPCEAVVPPTVLHELLAGG